MLYLGNNGQDNLSMDLPKEGIFESKSCCESRVESVEKKNEELEGEIKSLKKVSMINCKSKLEGSEFLLRWQKIKYIKDTSENK